MNFKSFYGMGLFEIAGLAVVVLAGCGDSSKPSPAGTTITELHGTQTLTFHIPNMGKQLKLTWGEWPNKVKQALVGLEGVKSVDDEWDRDPDIEDLDDLLFVTYDADKIKQQELLKTIQQIGFEPVIRQQYSEGNANVRRSRTRRQRGD